MDDEYPAKLQLFQELKDALKIKKINDELLEQLASSLRYLIHYSEKHNIPLPEKDKLISLIDHIFEISQKYPQTANFNINRKFTQRRSTDDYTDSILAIFIN